MADVARGIIDILDSLRSSEISGYLSSNIPFILWRPFQLFRLYGVSAPFVLLFGSRTTWITEAMVLGRFIDKDAMEFRKAVQDECTMVSVAVCMSNGF
jgi:hypothetical protein